MTEPYRQPLFQGPSQVVVRNRLHLVRARAWFGSQRKNVHMPLRVIMANRRMVLQMGAERIGRRERW
jgi:hypothetical protein